MPREIMGLCQRSWDPGEEPIDHRGYLHCLPVQHRLDGAKFDWTYGDTECLREPVDFMQRYPKNRVVADLPRIRKIAFTLHKDRVAMFDRSCYPLTPSFMIAWVEAEGYVIQAFGFDDAGNGLGRHICSNLIAFRRKLFSSSQTR